jgi:hypothetical protein
MTKYISLILFSLKGVEVFWFGQRDTEASRGDIGRPTGALKEASALIFHTELKEKKVYAREVFKTVDQMHFLGS